MCDKDGNFEFNNLADGEYYVIAFMLWGVPGKVPTVKMEEVLCKG